MVNGTFRGNLSQIDILDLISLLVRTNHVGKLIVWPKEGAGCIFVDNGVIKSANFGDK